MRIDKDNHGFIGLLELLAVATIIGFLMFFLMKRFTTAPVLTGETKQTMSEQGIDTTNYKTIVDTTRTSLNEIQKKQQEQLRQITDNAANNNQ
jgi:hypothetical protein